MKRSAALVLLLLLAFGLARGESMLTLPEQNRITRPGSYRLQGTLSGGQVLVDCGKDDAVTLILDGVEITSPDSPAIEVKRAGQVRVILAAGSQSVLRVGKGARAAFFSKADLVMEGTGALYLEAPEGHGIHSKQDVTLSGGSTRIHVKKDGIKAGGALRVLGGSHQVSDSQEGLEGHTVLVSDGTLHITAQDDGINASGGKDADLRQQPDPGGENHWIRITGGSLTIQSRGDGMDANGDLAIEGGDIRISGPVSGQDSALDAHGDITISGGSLMAFGAADEAEAALDAGQSVSLVVLKQWVMGGQEVSLHNQEGEAVLSFTPAYQWNSVVLSSPAIKKGEACSLWVAGQKLIDFVMGD